MNELNERLNKEYFPTDLHISNPEDGRYLDDVKTYVKIWIAKYKSGRLARDEFVTDPKELIRFYVACVFA